MSATIAAKKKEGLAIRGGKPAITQPFPQPVRWGGIEKRQLDEMLEQKSLFYWNGPQTRLLVERFQKLYPLKHVMPCSSGTAALHIAVAAAGIGPGDEVITTAITDMGTVIGILYQQGVPVFADLERYTCNPDPSDVQKKITPRTKAIIAVHLMGNPCRIDELRDLADRHKLVLIEDCAQAWGAKFRGKPLGTVGDIACFSLNDFKHIGCGDGGIVASNDGRFGPVLQKFGDKAYDRVGGTRTPEFLAPNYRITEPQSAVAAAQLTRLEGIVEKRSAMGFRLTSRLEDIHGIHPHEVNEGNRCSFWFYILHPDFRALSCSRKEFVEALKAEGVPCSEGYIAMPLYKYPIFQKQNFFAGRWPIREMGLTSMDYTKVSCARTEEIIANCVLMPFNEAMDEKWIDGTAEAIRKVAGHFSRE